MGGGGTGGIIDLDDVEAKITEKTKLITIVH